MAPRSNSEATHQAPSPSHPYKRSTPQMYSIAHLRGGCMERKEALKQWRTTSHYGRSPRHHVQRRRSSRSSDYLPFGIQARYRHCRRLSSYHTP